MAPASNVLSSRSRPISSCVFWIWVDGLHTIVSYLAQYPLTNFARCCILLQHTLSAYFRAISTTTSCQTSENVRNADSRVLKLTSHFPLNLFLFKLGREPRWRLFQSDFRYFDGEQKIEDLTDSKTFCTEILQTLRLFCLAKKKLGGQVHFKNIFVFCIYKCPTAKNSVYTFQNLCLGFILKSEFRLLPN